MRNRHPIHVHPAFAAILATFLLTGCEAVKGIFKAGFWVGLVVAVIALFAIAGVARMARG